MNDPHRITVVRRILIGIGLIAVVLVLPAVAVAHSGAALAVRGAGVSLLEADTRSLVIAAEQHGTPTDADGAVRFVHLGPAGLSRFRGVVDCLQLTEAGLVQISGRVTGGVTAAGIVLDGLDYAFTISTSGAQSFSLPRFGVADSIEPCSGGRVEIVPVSGGGFVVTEGDS